MTPETPYSRPCYASDGPKVPPGHKSYNKPHPPAEHPSWAAWRKKYGGLTGWFRAHPDEPVGRQGE